MEKETIVMIKFFKNKDNKEVRMVTNDENPQPNEIELKANDTDAAKEKHVPVIEKEGNSVLVKVGSIPHPMTVEHHIAFIVLVTDKNIYMEKLNPTLFPEAHFELEDDEKILKAYEYCNLHGLWVKEE